jgi:arylsulfatase A-like enzyme
MFTDPRWTRIAILALVFWLGRSLRLEAASSARPDVLVILADDLGFSDLGCYGGEIRTPNLDALAEHGLRYTNFYNTARCWPSRAALLTGYYAQQVRRDTLDAIPRSGGRGVRPGWAPLVPELLKASRYRSFHSGKWHIDGTDREGGFDRGYDLMDHGRYFSPRLQTLDDQPLAAPKPGSGFYATREVANRAIEFLKQHVEEHGDQPFFGYVAFTAPHFPLQAEAEDIARYAGMYEAGWEEVRKRRWERMKSMGIVNHELPAMEEEIGPPYHFPKALAAFGPLEVARPAAWKTLSEEQRKFQATKMSIHAAMVDRMDREIGRIVAYLKEKKRFENTLILFLSDNGASAEMMVRDGGHDAAAAAGSAGTHLCLGPAWSSVANTPLRRHKTWVHEGGISTPLIMHWPAGIRAQGELRTTPAHLVDVVPSILEATKTAAVSEWKGLKRPEMPGRSLLRVAESNQALERPFLWWSHEGNLALREKDWKIVKARAGDWELYDLSKDRGERVNLASKEPALVQRLARLWWETQEEFVAQLKDVPHPEGTKPGRGEKRH